MSYSSKYSSQKAEGYLGAWKISMLELFGEDMRGSKTVKDFGKRAPP